MFKKLKKAIKNKLGNLALAVLHNNRDAIVDRLISYYPSNQLVHDVANFVVYSQIDGDYLEFGVYKGDSFCQAMMAALFLIPRFVVR